MKIPRVVHPLFFALYPALFLYSQNADQFPVRVIFKPILLSIAAAILVWAVAGLLLRSLVKGGLLTSIAVLLFFSYRRCVAAIAKFEYEVGGYTLGPQHVILPAVVILFLAAALVIWRTRRNLGRPTKILNIISVCLVAMPIVHIGLFRLRSGHRGGARESIRTIAEPSSATLPTGSTPNIYYIILDGYAQADVLRKIYEYDNGPFLQYLADKGFYVAGHSRANYCQTGLSLASSLNMQYLDELTRNVNPQSNDRQLLGRLIAESKLVAFLKERGYRFAAFSSGYFLTDIASADLYFSSSSLNEFERGMIGATPLVAAGFAWKKHRETIKFTLGHIADTTDCEGPLFVFAHVLAPHPPFVFGPDGEEITPEGEYTMADGSHLIGSHGITWDQYRYGYVRQLQHINKMMMHAIDSILSRSQTEPVIIIQADHGPGSFLDHNSAQRTCLTERFGILNAYRLPGASAGCLYNTITPVNTFRVLLNEYFGTDYKLLADRYYFAAWQKPFKYIHVTDTLKNEDVSKRMARATSRQSSAAAGATRSRPDTSH